MLLLVTHVTPNESLLAGVNQFAHLLSTITILHTFAY